MSTRDNPTRLKLPNTHPETLRLLGLVILVGALFLALRPGQFLSPLNIQSIGFALPEIGLLALAMTVAMASGGIDLSLVAIANLSAIGVALVGTMSLGSVPGTLLAIVVALAVGTLCGLLNGVLVAYVNIRPILATLATGQLYAGIGIVITGGKALYSIPLPIQSLGIVTFAYIPIVVFIFAAAALLIWFIMTRTGFGLRAVLFGSNPTAARYSGFKIPRVQLQTYALIGAAAGLAGILISARAASASSSFGGSYIMLAITIAVLGGTDPTGGKIRIGGVILATLLLQMVSNGFNLLQLSPYLYQIVQGLILAIFVVAAMRQSKPGGLTRLLRRPPTQPLTTAS